MAGLIASRVAAYAVLVTIPLAGLLLLLAVPELDVRWQHHPSHFWLVLAAAGMNAALAYATGEAARRRGDARIFLVSLAFLASAGFLFLHALSTPGVLLDESNTGFVVATPVGLTISAALLAASGMPIKADAASKVMAVGRTIRLVLILVMVAWGAISLARVGPLDAPPPELRTSTAMMGVAAIAMAVFAVAAAGYLRLYLRRPSRLVASVIVACVLLAQSMIAVAFSRSWHASWWEWHVLMLVAFAVVAWTARSQWREEPFSDLYLDDTAAGVREVSVIFADLQGYTSYSESHHPREVTEMLNAFFGMAVPAVVKTQQGEINQIVGDAIMVLFNARGDQPDHARRAASAALRLRDAAASLTQQHPDWPRLRIGLNTGEAVVGVVGVAGGRKYTVVGDTINLAARLESSAPVGQVVIGASTLEQLDGAEVDPLEPFKVKGKAEPVQAYVLHGLDDTGGGRR